MKISLREGRVELPAEGSNRYACKVNASASVTLVTRLHSNKKGNMEIQQLGSIAGTIGGICSIVAFFPQAYRIIQRRSASDISLLMYITIITGAALWMFYSYAFGL